LWFRIRIKGQEKSATTVVVLLYLDPDRVKMLDPDSCLSKILRHMAHTGISTGTGTLEIKTQGNQFLYAHIAWQQQLFNIGFQF
jgi:hypothetical protein